MKVWLCRYSSSDKESEGSPKAAAAAPEAAICLPVKELLLTLLSVACLLREVGRLGSLLSCSVRRSLAKGVLNLVEARMETVLAKNPVSP
jgi:hypothetical protein